MRYRTDESPGSDTIGTWSTTIDRALVDLLDNLLLILWLAIIGRAILSWFDRGMQNPISQALYAITEPFIAPIRQFMPRTGFIDLSPLIAILIIAFIRQALATAA
ncbi:MAG TPA: YggT family protein [Thermomicrobiales bacterium]|nr:YggT family protein [Thermomicrobiales bacterium]